MKTFESGCRQRTGEDDESVSSDEDDLPEWTHVTPGSIEVSVNEALVVVEHRAREDTLKQLRDLVCAHHDDLWWFWSNRDHTSASTALSVAEFCEGAACTEPRAARCNDAQHPKPAALPKAYAAECVFIR